MEAVRASIRDVPDFPKKGIVFKDITPVLGDRKLFRQVIDALVARWKDERIDKVVGIESRGFIFAKGAPRTSSARGPSIAHARRSLSPCSALASGRVKTTSPNDERRTRRIFIAVSAAGVSPSAADPCGQGVVGEGFTGRNQTRWSDVITGRLTTGKSARIGEVGRGAARR